MILFRHFNSKRYISRRRASLIFVIVMAATAVFSFTSGRQANAEFLIGETLRPVSDLLLLDMPQHRVAETTHSVTDDGFRLAMSKNGAKLQISGTDGDDIIHLVRNGKSLSLTRENGTSAEIPFVQGMTELVIDGLEGDDRLDLDFSGGNFPFAEVSFNGGPQRTTEGDSITTFGGDFESGNSIPVNGNDGRILYSGGMTGDVNLVYTGLEPISDLNVAVNFTINGTAALNFINIVNGPVVSGTQTTQVNDGGGGFELINFANKTNVTVNALDGSDQISFNNSLEGVGLATITINGGAGDDQFNINGPGSVPGNSYTFNGGNNNDLFSVSGGLLLAPITINGDAHTGVTPSTSDRLTVNSFASNVTQSNTSLQFSGGSTITFATAEQINLNNLNTLSVTGSGSADTITLSKPSPTGFRSVLNAGIEVNFTDPAASVGGQYFANTSGESDTLTVTNTGRVVDLRVAYNAGTGTNDVLNVFGNPGTGVARESYIVGATQDAGRLVLDPDGNMGFLKTSVVAANGDELDVSFNGLEPLNTDVPSVIFDVVLAAAADNATLQNDGVLLNGVQSMVVNDNAATFATTRFANKAGTTISGFLANDTINWQAGNIAAGLTSLGFNGFLPVGLGVDDNPGSATNRDVVTIAESVAAARNLTLDYSETVSRVDLTGISVSLRIDTAETVNYVGTAANNDLMTIIDKTLAVDPARVFSLTGNGASYIRNGGVGSGGEAGPDVSVAGLGGNATPLTVDGDAPTTFPGDRFFYDGPVSATVTPTGPDSGNITSAGLIGVHFQNYERLSTGGAADLLLTKNVNNPTPVVGSNVTFSLTLTNSGPNNANSVTVQDILPPGLTFVSSVATLGSYSSVTGNWTVGTLTTGNIATLQITTTVSTAGSKVNYAQVMASSVNDPDSTPGDGSTTQDDDDSVTVNPVATTPTPTSTPTATPTATPIPSGAGFEGDVAPRTSGDGFVISTDVTQQRRFATGLDTPNPAFNEAQRSDVAPRGTSGDGIINSADVIQTRRYATGLDPQTPAGGPTAPSIIPESISKALADVYAYYLGRELRVGDQPAVIGKTVEIPIEFTPYGDETAVGFTLEYDASKLADPKITIGDGAPDGSVLTVNIREKGRIAVLVDSTEAMVASAMPRRLITVTFNVIAESGGETHLRLTDSLASKCISDAEARTLDTRFVDGIVFIRTEKWQ